MPQLNAEMIPGRSECEAILLVLLTPIFSTELQLITMNHLSHFQINY